MAERDPFGRLPDDDPPESPGLPSNGTAAAAAEAVAAEEAAYAPQAAVAQHVVKRPRVAGSLQGRPLDPARTARIARRLVKLVVLAAVLFVVLGAIALLVSGG